MEQRMSLVTLGVAKLDGHCWEAAHNPFWTIAADGRIALTAE